MTKTLKMTVLIDNIARKPLCCEWGLSILIESDDKKILLDTGAGELFAANARTLGISLEDVDFAVLSHAHYDHSDGMDTFFSLNGSAPFYLQEGSRENCYGMKQGKLRYIGIRRGILDKYSERIRYAEGLTELAEGIWLVPHLSGDYSDIALHGELFTMDGESKVPDDFSHEQSLVIETEKGLAVFNSCSHTGMANILSDIKVLLGREDVYVYVGGLHLYKHSDEELKDVSRELAAGGIERIYTGHCTGDQAFKILKRELGDRIEQISSGFTALL